MSVNKHFDIIRKHVFFPVAIVAFLCLLLNNYYNERVRFAELSRDLAEAAALDKEPTKIMVGNLEDFKATAYCITGITKSGVPVVQGHVAADPKVIPLGSTIYVESASRGGIYQVTDTGRLIKGKIIDIFIPSYKESIEFGRRNVKVKVLRYGYGGETLLSLNPGNFISGVSDYDPARTVRVSQLYSRTE